MPDNRQWNDDRFYGAAGRRQPWQPCPPCPPCPPCGRPQPGPGRPWPGRPGDGRPNCPPGSGPFCGRWGSRMAASESMAQVHETEQETVDDLYMTDEQEKEWMEQDWLYMKQLYPNSARKLQRYVDDAADKQEYENSMMFDEYPDNEAVRQLVHEIIAAIQENEPNLLTENLFMDDMFPQPMNGQPMNGQPMNGQPANAQQTTGGAAPDQTWHNCVEVLIHVMLLAEMHHRRWRYFQMRRRFY